MPELIQTEDGSSTLFLDEYKQAMHSISGAYQESMLKHVIPSQILGKNDRELYVLDVGFGLGYNVLALVYEFILRKKESGLTVISLEKERSFSGHMNSILFNDRRDEIYADIKECYAKGSAQHGNIYLEILFGDARDSLNKIPHKFNAVFQDPFSPASNPELWSVDYFKALFNLMYDDCILTTYSSADHIRMAMLEAGLLVGMGPSVGKKREGTLAAKTGIIKLLEEERLAEIRSNVKSEPYRDPGFCLSREEITGNRLDAIRLKKEMPI